MLARGANADHTDHRTYIWIVSALTQGFGGCMCDQGIDNIEAAKRRMPFGHFLPDRGFGSWDRRQSAFGNACQSDTGREPQDWLDPSCLPDIRIDPTGFAIQLRLTFLGVGFVSGEIIGARRGLRSH